MKKTTIKSLTSRKQLYIILLALGVLCLSCNKEETPIPDPAPDIPPKSTMVMDFSDFTNGDTTLFKATTTYKNWGRAASNILVWNAIITINLAVPVASFHEAFNHEGVFDPEISSWVWSYNFKVSGIIHLAELHASIVNEGIKWEMYISKNNHYTDFLWYSGISNIANTEGYWELNKNPFEPSDFLHIDWNRDLDNETADIKYINIIPDNAENGSYIHYGITNELTYNAFYDIFSVNHDNMNNIEWNRENKEGRIRDEMHFGDFEWHCWNTDLLDTDCGL